MISVLRIEYKIKKKMILENRKKNCTYNGSTSSALFMDNQVSNNVTVAKEGETEKGHQQNHSYKKQTVCEKNKQMCSACTMCMHNYARNEMLLMDVCKHRICKNCAKYHFTISIQQNDIRDVVCPGCAEPKLTDVELIWQHFSNLSQTLRNILDEDVYDLMETKLRDFVLDMDPSVCKCPNCQFRCYTDTDGRRLCCRNCSTAFCIQCGKEWKSQHDGVSCEEFSRLIARTKDCPSVISQRCQRSEVLKKRDSGIVKEFDALEVTVLLKAKQKIIGFIVKELIKTEETYIKTLEYVISNYIPELQVGGMPKPLIGKQNLIFANIKEIQKFHKSLLPKLKQCENNASLIGQCFLDHKCAFLSLYIIYNTNLPNSNKIMSDFGSAFFKRKQKELGDCMGLCSYLIRPVQKLGQYPLFFTQFLNMIKKGESEYDTLVKAKNMLDATLSHINDFLSIEGLSKFGINLVDHGSLLNLDEFLVWHGTSDSPHTLHAFLFEKLILFVVKKHSGKNEQPSYQYKYSIKIRDVIQIYQHKENDTKFKLYWYCRSNTSDNFTMQALNSTIRNKWLNTISRLLLQRFCKSKQSRLK